MADALCSFIFKPTQRFEFCLPVIHRNGRLEDGRTLPGARFLCSGLHFHVSVPATLSALALKASVPPPRPQDEMSGEPVVRVEVAAPSDASSLRERLRRAGIPCHEADVRFPTRYLIDRRLKAGSRFGARSGRDRLRASTPSSTSRPPARGVDTAPLRDLPRHRDDPQAERLLSIALYGAGAEESCS